MEKNDDKKHINIDIIYNTCILDRIFRTVLHIQNYERIYIVLMTTTILSVEH